MPRLIIHDDKLNQIDERAVDADAQLPFVTAFGFSVRDYCGGAVPEVLWAQKSALIALDRLSALCPTPFTVTSAFRLGRSFPAALGLSFSLAEYSLAERKAVTVTACSAGFRLLPGALSGGLVRLTYPPPCRALTKGSVGCCVCLLQFLLTSFGYQRTPIDGRFQKSTLYAVKKFRLVNGLADSDTIFLHELKALFELTTLPPNATIAGVNNRLED